MRIPVRSPSCRRLGAHGASTPNPRFGFFPPTPRTTRCGPRANRDPFDCHGWTSAFPLSSIFSFPGFWPQIWPRRTFPSGTSPSDTGAGLNPARPSNETDLNRLVVGPSSLGDVPQSWPTPRSHRYSARAASVTLRRGNCGGSGIALQFFEFFCAEVVTRTIPPQ